MNLSNLSYPSQQLKNECHSHLIEIADWWVNNTQDYEQGGFYGEVSIDNLPVKNANKGIILNSRILWFFSEVAQELDNPAYRTAADRAYIYLTDYFIDKELGGVYWELDCTGKPINTKKQIYAQAFAIYALCAYYKLTENSTALNHALSFFELIELYAIDSEREGYLEAFTREWNAIEDLRLSDKDLNYPKSQNTHLHVLESYASLFQLVSSSVVGNALRYNIQMFDRYMIDRKTFHLRMFMDMDWKDFSPGFTYGHDIEAVWLLARALEVLGDKNYEKELLPVLLKVGDVNLRESLAADGHVKDSYSFTTQLINEESTWWVQAEGLVGFMYLYSVTGREEYFSAVENLWNFIKKYQIDSENGEWFWSSRLDAQPTPPHYKVGFWKCPYHNGRAMMEVIRLLGN
jgi:cellobiose epimerase